MKPPAAQPPMPICPTCRGTDEVNEFSRDGKQWFGCSRCMKDFQLALTAPAPAENGKLRELLVKLREHLKATEIDDFKRGYMRGQNDAADSLESALRDWIPRS